ncbi:MAG: cation:proton antiporter [Neisseriaceae bacterium]|nr:cation:proton antiporter [Neisseriaceae bacterium]
MTDILLYIFIYLIFAIGAVLLSQKFGLGSVLGYLMAGVMIGPVLGLVGEETQFIQHIAEFGVVMMLFLVGLELEPKKLWKLRRKLLGLGGLQVGLTLFIIAIIVHTFGYGWRVSITIGCILALSSTAIVLQTFNEKNLISSQGGQAGFAVLLFQDVAAIPMLALLPSLSTYSHKQESEYLLIEQSGWVVALVSVIVIAIVILGVRHLVPIIFRFIIKSRIREMFTAFMLALVVGVATIMSAIGLSAALGAFVAGVGLANSPYRHEMESHIEPFKGILLGLFFITVGANINFSVLRQEFFLIVSITLGVLLVKALILFALGKLFRLKPLANKLFALALSQAGEFGFVLLSIAQQNRILPVTLHNRITLIVTLSMLLTPLLFLFYEKVLSQQSIKKENQKPSDNDIPEENSVVLLGHGRFGQQINSLLTACGFHITVIDDHADRVEGLARYGIKTYYGDATRPELLNSIGLAQAKLLVVAVGNNQSVEIVDYVRRHYPHLTILARAYDRFHAFDLHHAGADFIIRETVDSAIRSGRIALEQLGFQSDKAREIIKFYAMRDRDLSDKIAQTHNTNIPHFANEQMINAIKDADIETKRLIDALIRGEPVEWEEQSWTWLKKGIS